MSIVRFAWKNYLDSRIQSYIAGTLPAFLIFSLYESLKINPALPPHSKVNSLTRFWEIFLDVSRELRLKWNHFCVFIIATKLPHSSFVYEFLSFIFEQTLKDLPEELPLRNVILFIVGEISMEISMMSADFVIQLFDRRRRIIFNWTCIGIDISNKLKFKFLTFFLPWRTCFINFTEQWLYLGRTIYTSVRNLLLVCRKS